MLGCLAGSKALMEAGNVIMTTLRSNYWLRHSNSSYQKLPLHLNEEGNGSHNRHQLQDHIPAGLTLDSPQFLIQTYNRLQKHQVPADAPQHSLERNTRQ